MAEENISDVPPPPPVPENPASNEKSEQDSATLKVPASVELPEKDAEGTQEPAPDVQTGNPSEGGSVDSGASEDKPTGPVVENGPNGQTVTMPDGTVITTRTHPYPISNSELADYELTHHGDQQRYPYVPGDAAYTPYSDPAVPDSHLARRIESEISSFADRVKNDAEAEISPIWNGLKKVFDGELRQAVESGTTSGKVEL